MEQWLEHLMISSPHLIYGVIIFVSFIEGPVLAMVCGLLIKLGVMPFLFVYLALMLGDLIGDVFWYSLGRHFGYSFIRRFGKYFSVTEERVESVKTIFHKYHNPILLISKITMGFGFALVTLITAGIVRIPFGKYMALNFLGQFIWTGILMSIGYFLGHFYLSFDNVFSKMSTLALIILIFVVLVSYGNFIKNRLIQKVQ